MNLIKVTKIKIGFTMYRCCHTLLKGNVIQKDDDFVEFGLDQEKNRIMTHFCSKCTYEFHKVVH